MGDDVSKHTLELAKCSEQVFRFNRELTETKDILKSFMVKYDTLVNEIGQRTNTSGQTPKYIVIFIIIMLLGIIGGMGFFIYKNKKTPSPTKFGKKK